MQIKNVKSSKIDFTIDSWNFAKSICYTNSTIYIHYISWLAGIFPPRIHWNSSELLRICHRLLMHFNLHILSWPQTLLNPRSSRTDFNSNCCTGHLLCKFWNVSICFSFISDRIKWNSTRNIGDKLWPLYDENDWWGEESFDVRNIVCRWTVWCCLRHGGYIWSAHGYEHIWRPHHTFLCSSVRRLVLSISCRCTRHRQRSVSKACR